MHQMEAVRMFNITFKELNKPYTALEARPRSRLLRELKEITKDSAGGAAGAAAWKGRYRARTS